MLLGFEYSYESKLVTEEWGEKLCILEGVVIIEVWFSIHTPKWTGRVVYDAGICVVHGDIRYSRSIRENVRSSLIFSCMQRKCTTYAFAPTAPWNTKKSRSTPCPDPVFVNITVCCPLLNPCADPSSWFVWLFPLLAEDSVTVVPSTEME